MKILKFLLILLFFSFSLNSLAQNQSEIRAYYGISSNSFGNNQDLIGAASYDPETAYELGMRYILRMQNGLGLEGGVGFWTGDIEITSAPMPEQTSRRERLQITSIPVLLNYRFLEFFFLNGGPVLDFQNSDNSFDSQSGIGISAGIGLNHYIRNFVMFVNPNFRYYALIPFEKENHHSKLSGFAIQFGMGYRF
ncbi:outer membrane beta-barrel protein [Salegentibacter sediminis]|uniref:outer membrane beta-barrel protein n=1 Tax=Salegentibacter sediminis TaxID=1930251 RepID=UPI0009BDBA03|nr:outer membrane beta-barrel protein [Salegentibacter sediminis]